MRTNLIAICLLAFAFGVRANPTATTPGSNAPTANTEVGTTTTQASSTAKKDAAKECKKAGLKGKSLRECVKTKTNG